MKKKIREEKSDFEILNNKISNIKIKNSLNSRIQKEALMPTPHNSLHENLKSKMKIRPYSNFLPKHNKNTMTKPTKINNYNLLAIEYKRNEKEYKSEQKSENSKILSMSDKEMNSTNINNTFSNKINLIKEFNFLGISNLPKQNQINNNKRNQEIPFIDPIKRTKSNFEINKTRIVKKIHKINRYLSPKIYFGSKNKKILSAENTSNRCASPSTENNSNINSNNNSYSLFGNSFISSNFQRNIKNSLNLIYEKSSNNIQNINGNIIPKINQDYSKKMTVIEYQLSKLLAKKERQNKKKNEKDKYKASNKNESFNVDEIYLKYAKKIEEISQKESRILNKYYNNSNKKEKNTNTSQNIDCLYANNNFFDTNSNTNRYISTNDTNNNRNCNLKYKLYLSNNYEKKEKTNKKYSNPKIKYSFLDKIINNIDRKVNFVDKNSEKELELDITRIINGELYSNDIYDKSEKNKDFITYGYELIPERILQIKQINNDNIQKKREKENIKEPQFKRIKRPTTSFLFSHKKGTLLYKNNKIKNKNEEAKGVNDGRNKNVFISKQNNDDKIYSLIEKKNELTRNNCQLNFYTQAQIKTNPNIAECLGESLNRNKLNWNLISKSDKEKGKILWKKLTKIKPIYPTTTPKKEKRDEILLCNTNYNIINNNQKENENNKINRVKINTRNYELYHSFLSERINSAYFKGKINLENFGVNEECEEESPSFEEFDLENENIKIKNVQKIRANQKRFTTQIIEKLENVKKMKNENGFKNTNIFENYKISENEEGDEEEEEKEEEEEDKGEKEEKDEKIIIKKYGRKYWTKRNKTEKQKLSSERKYKHKIYEKNNTNKKVKTKYINKNRINKSNKNQKSKKEILLIQKLNKNSHIKNRNQDLMGLSGFSYNKSKNKRKVNPKNNFHNYNIKIKHNQKKKSNKKPKDKNKDKKNEENLYEESISLNSSDYMYKKCQSLNIENEKPYINYLNPTIFASEEKQYLSDENNEKNEDIILDNMKRKIVKLSINKKKNRPGLLFEQMVKNYQGKYKEDKELDKFYNDLFNKYDKDEDEELEDVVIFGLNLKIKKKTKKKFYNKLISKIKLQNKIKREQSRMNFRLSLILDGFNKNNIEEQENKTIKRNKKRKNKTNFAFNSNLLALNKGPESEIPKSKRENEYKKDFFWGIKIDSIKELEKKKEEVLLRLKHDIKYKINEGVFSQSEMDNFLKFQKRINELAVEGINNRVYIKQLEEGFNSFEEELKSHEEKKRNERRINSFVDSMNFDLYRRDELKKAIEKYFCHPVDFKKTNIINKLSAVRIDKKSNKI